MATSRFLSLLLFGGVLAGCEEAPAPTCTTAATLTRQICNVAHRCQVHPDLLTLGDGQQLRPQGPTWEAWLANSANASDQLLIDYKTLPTLAVHPWSNAEITCISEAPGPGGR